MIIAFCLTIICAYLLGGVNFGIIVSKIVAHTDIRTQGSGNAGATNVLRVLGAKPAIYTLLGDYLKAVAAVGLAMLWFWLFTGDAQYGIGKITAALFAVLGHMYPLYFKFKGGKGVITCLGGVTLIHPLFAAISLSIFIIIVLISRYVSLGSILGCFSYFVATVVFNAINFGITIDAVIDTALTGLVVFWVIIKHRTNMKRLLSKTESKISFKKKAPVSAGEAEEGEKK